MSEPFDEEHESAPVSPEDLRPPTHLEESGFSTTTRVQIVGGVTLAAAILVGSIIGFAHAHSGPTLAATPVQTLDPSAPQPAGSVNASLDATPFPVYTRPPYSLLPTANTSDQQAVLQAQAAQQQRDQAQMAEMIRAQQLAQQLQAQQQVPALGNTTGTNGTAQTAITHGEITAPGQQTATGTQVRSNNANGVSVQPQIADNQPQLAQPGVNALNRANEPQNLQTQNTIAQKHFMEDNEQSTGIGYVRPQSDFEIEPGTVINARLVTAINSDLPGPAKAIVTQPVYDSRSHSTVVIPQGATLYGNYDSAIVSGQNRLLIAWNEITFPNSNKDFRMGGMPGVDTKGSSGFSGSVDKHAGELYKSAFLLTVLGVAEGLLVPQQASVLQTQSFSQVAAQNAGTQLANVGNKIIDQQIQRPPTITISPPYEFDVFVTKPLPLDAFQG